MSSPDVEGMLLELESEIFTLKLDDVVKLANDMKLDGSVIKDKSRFSILKAIRQAIEEEVGDFSDKEAVKTYLSGIKAFLGPPPLKLLRLKRFLKKKRKLLG